MTVDIPDVVIKNLKVFFRRHSGGESRFIIYSAGGLTRSLISNKYIDSSKISAIFDGNKDLQGSNLEGIEILGIEKLATYKGAFLLLLSNRFFSEIYEQIRLPCYLYEIKIINPFIEQKEICFNEFQGCVSDETLFSAFKQFDARKYLWHVALPKSGSTWLTFVISYIYKSRGWDVDILTNTIGVQPQEVEPRRFFYKGGEQANLFFQHQHCLYSQQIRSYIVESGCKCIVQTRSLGDVVVSLRDYFKKLLMTNDPESSVLPLAARTWDDEKLINFIIDHILPWLVKFISGWRGSDLIAYNKIYLLNYDDLLSAPEEVVMNISDWAGLDFSRNEVERALDAAKQGHTRKNVGLIGRGGRLLTADQKRRIGDIAAYYFSNSELPFML